MGRFKHFIAALFGGLALILLVHAQDQSDFISIDCGLQANWSYTEPSTSINYISDAAFIDTGVSKKISSEFEGDFQQQAWTLRSFPEGIRNCYSINVTQGQKYLIRATFLYGNYDGQSIRTMFMIALGLAKHYNKWKSLSTSLTIDSEMYNPYWVPSVVMSTAATPINESGPLEFYLPPEANSKYYVYMHFAELVELKANQSRSFNITLNGELSVVAITNIKSKYGVERNWQGDPCAPQAYSWEGLNCSYDGYNPPRIISLNLSSSGLTGEISAYISNLVMLQYLDLSNNSLTGSVPDFLSQLKYLRVLNLERNQLTGSIPAELIQRAKKGSLSLKNLTTLVGYYYEGANMGLIYEYMANGDLEAHLSGENTNILSWEARLQIAMDAAQGLEYLHHGCKPPIIHRDVKSTNILLNEKFRAKLADFGLSKTFPTDDTHLSTVVAGTPGYLDPEYYLTNWLTEKSDVYSFGVVLLELITNRPVIERSQERTHISQWVSFKLAKGDIENIVDPTLCGNYNINSVWKAVEIAMVCVSPTSSKRPKMDQVVAELKECLVTELAQRKEGDESESKDSVEMININMTTELSPLAR
uniref:Protein kinase domain-containing protein n=1 Tax=Fagus sylvatica TaxID=28930 RepID=A0A2N9FN08_FAGSY